MFDVGDFVAENIDQRQLIEQLVGQVD